MKGRSLEEHQEVLLGLEGAEREGYLERLRAADGALAGEVETWLADWSAGLGALGAVLPQSLAGPGFEQIAEDVRRAQEASGRAPLLPAAGPPTAVPEALERVGPYKVLQTLGQGGFGVVYLAEQLEPVRRRVALKIVKRGMDTDHVVARFRRERQALAVLDHPGIARVFDAGSTDDGRPYFAMEYVPGVPITEYCDRHKLDTDARLAIFIKVCEAVQHAHQKGVLHRDIKPSNVLVEVRGDTPEPRVIDFGLAKAVGPREDDESLLTHQGYFLGTLEYASPEQARSDGLDVDTRTDIYSLGVLLYQLLTGLLPFANLRSAALLEAQRILVEDEPPRPSTRLMSQADSTEERARLRRIDAVALQRRLRGDLDWIVMKAMEKDRTRRYASASELAAEVQRYLSDEPVLASPPNVLDRAVKFVRRNRFAMGAVAAVLVTLVLGVVGTGLAYLDARAEEARALRAEDDARAALSEVAGAKDQAEQRLIEAQGARREAERDRRRAEHDASVAEAAQSFLERMLMSPDPWADLGSRPDVTVAELLERTSSEATEAFAGLPEVEASVRATLGRTFLGLGRYAEARAELELSLERGRSVWGAADPRNLMVEVDLGRSLVGLGETEEAEVRVKAALDRLEETLGRESPQALAARLSWIQLRFPSSPPAEMEAELRDLLNRQEALLGTEDPSVLSAWQNVGFAAAKAGHAVEAERLLRRVVELDNRSLPSNHPKRYIALANLGTALRDQGRLEEALEVGEAGYAGLLDIMGAGDEITVAAASALGSLYLELGRPADAGELLESALRAGSEKLGTDHPELLPLRGNLALLFERSGRLDDAEALMRETLELSKQVLGERAAQTQTYMHNLAGFVGLQGRYEEALVLLERCVELRMETLGETHWRTLRSRVTQAQTLGEMGAGEAALQLLREVLDISRAELGAAHIETQQTALELGRQLFRMGAAEEAFGVLEGQWRALVGAGRAGVDARPQVITLRFEMAFILAAQGRRDDAWSIADEALGLALQALGPEHPETRYVARWLVGQLLDAGHAADAEAVRARLTTAR